jgi:CelD/BcsL family acetyltransferase involved in cellulose biosynthesis
MSLQVTRFPSIRELPSQWRDLFEQNEGSLQFDQTLAWLETFEQHALAAGEVAEIVCVADSNGTPLMCLPLKCPGGAGSRSAQSLSSYYTSLFAPLWVSPGKDAALIAAALRAGLARRGVVRLEPLATDDPLTDALASTFAGKAFVSQRYFKFGNWYLEVGGRSFAEYFKQLPSQLRNTVTRKEKKLRAEVGVTVEIVQEADALPQAIAAYEEVYASSWKTAEPHPRFVPELMQAMARRGWLRLGVVRLNGEPIAAQIWVVKDAVASIFKLAYKEQHARLSAGSILTTTLMRHVIDVDGVRIVDYLTGDDNYKRDWMSHRRERIGFVVADLGSIAGLMFAVRHIFPTLARGWLRNMRRKSRPTDAP